MYVDKHTMMANALAAYTTQNAIVYGDYSIDLGTTGKYADLGAGRPVAVVFTVDTAFVGAGASVTFNVLCDVDLTMDASSVIVASTGAIAITSLTAGKVIVVPIPKGVLGSTYDHLGVSFLSTGAATTAGACSAFVAMDW